MGEQTKLETDKAEDEVEETKQEKKTIVQIFDDLCKRLLDLKKENVMLYEQVDKNEEEIKALEGELDIRILKGEKGKLWDAMSKIARRRIGRVTDAEIEGLMRISPALVRDNDSVITIKISNPYEAKDVKDELGKRGFDAITLKEGKRSPRTLTEIDREIKTNAKVAKNIKEIHELLMIQETKEISITPTIYNDEAGDIDL